MQQDIEIVPDHHFLFGMTSRGAAFTRTLVLKIGHFTSLPGYQIKCYFLQKLA
jgi:hypothetical protein